MDADFWINIALVLLFVVIGGVFAGTEIALVSLREGQIRELDKESKRGRKVAALARDSGLFLSAVQIGVTFAGFFSSAFGASTIAPYLTPYLEAWGIPAASTISLVVMTIVISYLSLVFGELVPKRVALQMPSRISKITGPPLSAFAKLMRPFIWFLEKSTNTVLRLFGLDPSKESEEMSDEEVRDIVTTHEGFDPEERTMVRDIFNASTRLVREVMRHRSTMDALQKDQSVTDACDEIEELPHSRFPVYDESIDDVVGFVHVRDLLEARQNPALRDGPISALMRDILTIPGTSALVPAMTLMRKNGKHIAIVVDEYGGTDGLVTLEDLIEELVGEIWDEYDTAEHRIELRLHESKTFEGSTNLEDFAERTGVTLEDGPYETVAGWMLARLGRLGAVGDTVPIPPERTMDPEDDEDGADQPVRYELQVETVDGNRIASVKLLKTLTPDRDAAAVE